MAPVWPRFGWCVTGDADADSGTGSINMQEPSLITPKTDQIYDVASFNSKIISHRRRISMYPR
jgi:hypothetical protein